jgi:hypothetical protein
MLREIRLQIWLALALVIGISTPADAQNISLYRENFAVQSATQPRRFSHLLSFDFSPRMIRHYGGSYRLIYSFGSTALDLQGAYKLTSWDALGVPASDSDLYADASNQNLIPDPSSEFGRIRSARDAWSQWIAEIGLSYRGRLVPGRARNWMQSARVSIGYTGLTDTVNRLRYSGLNFGTEFGLWYAWKPKILIGPSIGYRFGSVSRSGESALNSRRLPILSLNASLGVNFLL